MTPPLAMLRAFLFEANTETRQCPCWYCDRVREVLAAAETTRPLNRAYLAGWNARDRGEEPVLWPEER